jgi:hypothetical protein
MAFADYLLVMTPPVTHISCSERCMAFPWVTFVNHHFIAVVQVIITISWRQITCVYPYIVLIINILMVRYIIVGINIRDIIIFCMVIANRAPIRLTAYIEPKVYT